MSHPSVKVRDIPVVNDVIPPTPVHTQSGVGSHSIPESLTASSTVHSLHPEDAMRQYPPSKDQEYAAEDAAPQYGEEPLNDQKGMFDNDGDEDKHIEHGEDFDWDKDDEDELDSDEEDASRKGSFDYERTHFFLSSLHCFKRAPLWLTYIFVVLLGLALIAVAVVLHFVQAPLPSIPVQHLTAWFTWAAFMWLVIWVTHFTVESVPWSVKKMSWLFNPKSTELIKMRMAYYNSLKRYIKCLLIAAWNYGSFSLLTFLPWNLYDTRYNPTYIYKMQQVMEVVLIATGLLFAEKFCLQLIVTGFHKKAYSERMHENEFAIRVLDKLKLSIRKTHPTGTPVQPTELIGRMFKLGRNEDNIMFASRSPRASFDKLDAQGQNMEMKPRMFRSATDTRQSSFWSESKSGDVQSERLDFDENAKQQNQVRFHTPQTIAEESTTIHIPPAAADDPTATLGARHRRPGMHKHSQSAEFFSSVSKKLTKLAPGNRHNYAYTTDLTPSTYYADSPNHSAPTTSPPSRSNTADGDNPLFRSPTGMSIFYNPNAALERISGSGHVAQAKRLARKIYFTLKPPGAERDHLIPSDFYPYFDNKKEAYKAFGVFDNDGNGDITRKEIKHGVVRIYRERKNLSNALRDLSQATGKLDVIFLTVGAFLWAIICACVFGGSNVTSQLTPMWSLFLALSFIFGGTAKELFESIIFVFVTHPYDAGDRVFINGENWVVNEMGLITTTFKKWDGTLIYLKNSVLAVGQIHNVRRSGSMGETIDIQIDFNTPTSKIHALRDRLSEYVSSLNRDFTPGCLGLNMNTIENTNRITLGIFVEHRANWQDMGARFNRRTKLMFVIKETLEELDIGYLLPAQNIYVNEEAPELYNGGRLAGYGTEGFRHRNRSGESIASHQGGNYGTTSAVGSSAATTGGGGGGSSMSTAGVAAAGTGMMMMGLGNAM